MKKSKGSKPVNVSYKEFEKGIKNPISTTSYSFLECSPSITSKRIYDERIKLGGCKFSKNLWMFNGHGGGDHVYLDDKVWKSGQQKLDYVNLNPGEQVLIICTPAQTLHEQYISQPLASHSAAQQVAIRRGAGDPFDVMGKSVVGEQFASWCPGPMMIWNWAIKNKSPTKLMSSLVQDQEKMFGSPSLCVFTKKVPNIDLSYTGGGENIKRRTRAGLYKLPLSYEVRDPQKIEESRLKRLGRTPGWEDKLPLLEKKWAPYSKKTQKDREAHDISYFTPGMNVTSLHYPEKPTLEVLKHHRTSLKETIDMVRYNRDFTKDAQEGDPIINRSFTLVVFACRGAVKEKDWGESY